MNKSLIFAVSALLYALMGIVMIKFGEASTAVAFLTGACALMVSAFGVAVYITFFGKNSILAILVTRHKQ